MGLIRPVTKTIISSPNFGQPVYDILTAPVIVGSRFATLAQGSPLPASTTGVTQLEFTWTARANRAYRVDWSFPFGSVPASPGGNLAYTSLYSLPANAGTTYGNTHIVTSQRAATWGHVARGMTMFCKVLGGGLAAGDYLMRPTLYPAIASDVFFGPGGAWITVTDMGPDP